MFIVIFLKLDSLPGQFASEQENHYVKERF